MRTELKAILVILVLLLSAVFAPASYAAIFTVNSTADAVDAAINGVCETATPGQCTLRAAIQEANASVGVADTINLPAGTITLTLAGAGENLAATGDLDIGVGGVPSTITINGAGAALTIIDGNNADRVFETLANGTSVNIAGVTIRNGSSTDGGGGCVHVGAATSLVLNTAVVSNCTANLVGLGGGGGIDNSGSLAMNTVAITNTLSTGGAINSGLGSTTTWTNGTISGNSGGGINNGGTMTLTNVTVSGNTTPENGAGIDNDGTLALQNATISANTSTTAVNAIGGVRNRPPGSVTVANTIISGNIPANCGGVITSGGNNIDNGTTCGLAGLGDISGTDPLLVALADNGGALQTHALGPLSPAIDAGSAAGCPATDARAITRPVDGNSDGTAACDMGAFEFRPRKAAVAPASPLNFGTVTTGTTADRTVTITNDGDGGLLMGTMAQADALAAPFSIPVNNCNAVTLARAATCTLTVRFTPASATPATDTFSIESNDPLAPAIAFTVSGTGTAAGAVNRPPSAPALISPANGQTGLGTTVAFTWTNAVDPDGDALTHRVQNCPDPNFLAAGCAPVDVASAGASGLAFAGLGSLGAGILLIGFMAGSGSKRSRKALLMIAVVLITGAVFMSCSSGGGNGAVVPTEGQFTATGLTPGTTYYWKVVADDGRGGTSSSETRSYTTAP